MKTTLKNSLFTQVASAVFTAQGLMQPSKCLKLVNQIYLFICYNLWIKNQRMNGKGVLDPI